MPTSEQPGGLSPAGPAPAQPALPFLRLARHTYIGLATGWRGFAQIAVPWLVIPWVLHSVGVPLLALAGDIVLTGGLAVLSVAWHRHLLLGEPLGGFRATPRREVTRYLTYTLVIILALAGASLALSLLAAVPLILLGLVPVATGEGAAAAEAPSQAALIAMGLAVAVPALLVFMRLQLALPAVAVGDRRPKLATSWRATRGNAWRLLAGFALVTLPASVGGALLAILLLGLAEATGSLVLGWVARLAPIAAVCAQAPLLAGFLSYAYLFLERPGAGTASEAPAPTSPMSPPPS